MDYINDDLENLENMENLKNLCIIFDIEFSETSEDIDMLLIEKFVLNDYTMHQIVNFFNESYRKSMDLNEKITELVSQYLCNYLAVNDPETIIKFLTCDNINYAYCDIFMKYISNTNNDNNNDNINRTYFDIFMKYITTKNTNKQICFTNIGAVCTYPFNERIATLALLFKIKYIRDNMFYMQLTTGKNEETEGFFSYLIDENPQIPFDFEVIKPIIDIYIDDKQSLNILLNRIAHVLDVNIAYTHYQILDSIQHNQCSRVRFIVGILKIMFYIMNDRMPNEFSFDIMNKMKIFNEISEDYELDESTATNIDKKILIITLKTIKIGFVPLRKLYISLKKSIDSVFDENFTMKKKKQLLLEQINKLYDENIDLVLNFVNNLLQICVKNNIKITNSFVNDINDIVVDRVMYNNIPFVLSTDIIIFFVKLLNDDIKTNNHTKLSICLTIIKHTEINGFRSILDLKSEDYDITYNLTKSLLKFISEVDYFKMVAPSISDIFHQGILNVTAYFCTKLNTDTKEIVNLLESAFYKIVASANKFITDMQILCKQIIEEINKISNISPYLNSMKLATFKEQLKPLLMEYIRLCMTSTQTLARLLDCTIIDIKDYSPALVMPLSTFITSTLSYLADGKTPLYSIFHMNMETKDLTTEIFNLLAIACDNESFVNSLKFSTNIINDMLATIKINENSKKKIYNCLTNINNIDDNLNIPEEYLDPILFTEIKNPAMIPNVKQIYDRSSIMLCLYAEQKNPVTRESLTIEEFEKYQKNDDVKLQISDFMNKLNNYKYNLCALKKGNND